MRYYAIIDGEQKGPFSLEELPQAGVRPSTYVWCKDMSDWQKAEEIPDICRFFRIRIHDLMHPGSSQILHTAFTNETSAGNPAVGHTENEDPLADIPPVFRRPLRKMDVRPGPKPDTEPDPDIPPRSMLTPAIIATIFCFPPTGFIAIYYSILSARSWKTGNPDRSEGDKNSDLDIEYRDRRKMAHDYSRQARMWTGITVCFGMILYSFLAYNFT